MKNISTLIIIFFSLLFLLSCKKSSLKENKNIFKKEKIYHPIFLSFSPEMTESEFENEIKERTWDDTLELGKFIIELNSKKYTFDIGKGENSIILYYNVEEVHSRENLSIAKSEKILKEYDSEINSFIELFKSKKEYVEFPMPKLEENLNDVYLFRNENKSVLLTFRKTGQIIMSQKEKDNYYSKIKNKSILDLFNMKVVSGTEKFSLDIWLSYYSNEEIDKIISKTNETIRNRKIEKEVLEIEIKRKNKERNEKLKKNINNL